MELQKALKMKERQAIPRHFISYIVPCIGNKNLAVQRFANALSDLKEPFF